MRAAKRKWGTALATVLVVFLVSSAAWAAPGGVKGKPAKVKLRDIHGHWGEAAIARMVAQGLINGYEDLSFRPGNNVSHQEAIAMLVRAMGLEDQALAGSGAQVNLKHSQQLAPWARGYLAVAATSGLVLPAELAEIIPNKPATRGEVAMYLARVLIWARLNPAPGGAVNFADAGEISAQLMAYVSPVYTWGLMLGDEQRKFQPHRPVTRAEMAVILGRLSDLLENGQEERERISGTLVAVSAGTNPAIKVEKLTGGQLDIPVAGDAAIYRNNRRVELADLRTGDLVEVILDADQAVFIAATAPQLVAFVQGTVKSVNTAERTLTVTLAGGSEAVYGTAAGVQVKLNGGTIPLSGLQQGDQVKLYLREGLAVRIEARRADTLLVSGTVTEVVLGSTAARISVTDGVYEAVYRVADNAKITLDGEEADLQDLRPGYRVELKVTSGQVVEIKARTFFQVEGDIVSLIIGAPNKIVLRGGDGTETTYPLAASAIILVDGGAQPFTSLAPGWSVQATVQDGLVVKIEAETP